MAHSTFIVTDIFPPCMVGFCHGGNMPASHDGDDDDDDDEDDDDDDDNLCDVFTSYLLFTPRIFGALLGRATSK